MPLSIHVAEYELLDSVFWFCFFFMTNIYGKQGQLVSIFTEFLMCEVAFFFCYFLFGAA